MGNYVTINVEIESRSTKKIKESFNVHCAKQLNEFILQRINLSSKHYHVEYLGEDGNHSVLYPDVVVQLLPKELKVRVKLYSLTPREKKKKRKKTKQLCKENVKIVTNKQKVPTVLGNGTYGIVYLGEYDHKRVAVKILTLEDQEDRDLVEKEVKIMNENDHPNVLKCYGCFFAKNELGQDQAHIVMELCSGGDLFDNLHRKNGLLNKATDEELIVVMLQIALGVQYLHRKGIIHRDLKSNNILLSWNIWKVCDFGSSKLSQSLRGKTIHGTPEYLAPEILNVYERQRIEYTHVVDIYSLGVLFWEIWARERVLSPYFKKYGNLIASDPMKFVSFLHKNDIRPPLTERFMRSSCPEELKILISKCWAKSPSDRPQSMESIVSVLKKVHMKVKRKKLEQIYFEEDHQNLYYHGEYSKGQKHGMGKEYYIGSTEEDSKVMVKYEGEFFYDEFIMGKYYDEKGVLIYEGEFFSDDFHGFGRTYHPDGNIIYEGSFKNSKFDGLGKLYRIGVVKQRGTDGGGGGGEEEEEGEGGPKIGFVIQYEGYFKQGVFFGRGKYYNEFGRLKYDGKFKMKKNSKFYHFKGAYFINQSDGFRKKQDYVHYQQIVLN